MRYRLTERDAELVYFALSRLLDDFKIDGVYDVNDNEEFNEIDTLRERFAKITLINQETIK